MPTIVTDVFTVDTGTERLIPLYLSAVSAGFPSPADDYIEEFIDLNEYLITNPPATFVVRVKGDSMQEAGIHSGDLIIVDRSLDPCDGDVVIAAVEGQLTVKRYRNDRHGLRLVAEKAGKPPVSVPIDPESEVQVWGVVKHVIHSPRSHGTRRRSR